MLEKASKGPVTDKTEFSLKAHSRVIAFAATVPLTIVAYLAAAIALEGTFCGPSVFKAGPMGSAVNLEIGVGGIVLASMILLLRSSDRIGKRKLTQPFFTVRAIAKNDYLCVAALCYCLLLCSAVWTNYLQSYYCVSENGILVRPNAYSAPRTLTWDDVEIVRAQCGKTIRGRWGSTILTLSDGSDIPLRLNTPMEGLPQRDYDTLHAALAGRHYLYDAMPSVDRNLCPPVLFRHFTNWHD